MEAGLSDLGSLENQPAWSHDLWKLKRARPDPPRLLFVVPHMAQGAEKRLASLALRQTQPLPAIDPTIPAAEDPSPATKPGGPHERARARATTSSPFRDLSNECESVRET